jgi:7,8-dihydropterin-6-yl-methyl-4-(beta-D-ribofuranosyl)aminobenzene 5'-phosphate synthase
LENLVITVVAEDSVEYESPYLGQHGISLLLKACRSGLTRHVLMDVAQNPEALLQNMALMGIAPSCIDSIVLTHCHYDHTQGVARVVQETGKRDVPIIAHPDLFRPHFIQDPMLRHVGVMDGDSASQIEASGGRLLLTKDSLTILPGLLTTGEVTRQTDFEEVGMNLFTITDGTLVPDGVLDDITLVAEVTSKGLVIITGCSHAGIVNICLQAMHLTGTKKIHGIIGGFHLIEASQQRIRKTVRELEKFKPDWIAAGHCTGFNAQIELHNTFKDRFTPLHTGMVFEI